MLTQNAKIIVESLAEKDPPDLIGESACLNVGVMVVFGDAVEIEGKAILLLGDSQSGKTSFAHYLESTYGPAARLLRGGDQDTQALHSQ